MPRRAEAFEQRLALINKGFKAQRIGVSIHIQRKGLALLSTLPSKLSSKAPKQQL
tara:strand:- start:640 stop:804 length:165 start_codon:yes stop_codon:yes gene_type:complete